MGTAEHPLEDKDLVRIRKTATEDYYRRIRAAKEEGRPVAYTTALGPTELLYAMGVEVCMPENYVTICCARQMAKRFCQESENRGVSSDLCSYTRCGLGMMYQGDGPMGALPRPDFIVSVVSACDPHSRWWEMEARYFGVPLFTLDAPYNFNGQIESHHKAWMISEFKRLIRFVEDRTGLAYDEDRVSATVRTSGDAHTLFRRIQDLRRSVPAPRGMREMVGDLFYLITQAGRRESVDYYQEVLRITQGKAAAKESPIGEERLRLYFHNIPLWFNLQTLDWLGSQGASVVMDFYTNHVWHGFFFDGGEFDSEDPFENLASKWLWFDNHVGLPVKVARSLRACREWECEGAIFFSNRSCKVYSIGQEDHKRVLERELGISSFRFEAEMADPRSFDMARWKEHIRVFLDLLYAKKK